MFKEQIVEGKILILEKFIQDNLNDYLRNSFLEGLSNFSLLLLLFDSSNLVSRAT